MPQPWTYRGGLFNVGSRVFGDRPEYCAAIGRVAIEWSHLEQVIATTFCYLVSSHDQDVLDLYSGLIDLKLRQMTFKALSKSKLSPDMIERGQSLFTQARKRSAERAKIVHGVWGEVVGEQRYILLINQADYLRRLGLMFREPYRKEDGKFDNTQYPFLNLEAQSYTLRDIENIHERIHKLVLEFVVYAEDVLSQTNTKPLPFRREEDVVMKYPPVDE